MWKAAIIWICLAGTAFAGPWPRGKGNHFISASLAYDIGGSGVSPSYYHEMGLSPRTTLILEYSKAFSGGDRVIARLSRSFELDRLNLLVGLTAGAGHVSGDAAGVLGLSAGRDITLLGMSGWASGAVIAEATKAEIVGKGELTLGINARNGAKYYAQVSGTTYLNPAPTISIVRPLWWSPPITYTITRYPPEVRLGLNAAIPIAKKTWLDVGLSRGVQEGGSTRIKLGLWRQF
ncbi:hypothetical protein ATO9_06295 [Pseudooceanicola atlanticus]|uniref:Porin domain-containing protein n=2 Tax=Pseudooceanicola atlanticus TaxID=1461694 RepID=A0A0A0EGU3_9RHOB|nr:hypothetical protein [Pseudooceanicola atlanticus]KGM49624.1 hypothetical protein ATO9_06295 [Pseudooceanicola atlanticus]